MKEVSMRFRKKAFQETEKKLNSRKARSHET